MAAGTYNYYRQGQAGQPSPPPEQQATYQETPPPPPQPAPPSRPPRVGSDIMAPRAAGMIALLGVIIFFVGIIVGQSTSLMERPDSDDYDDFDDYEKDLEDYEDRIRNLDGSGRILMWVGAMIIVIPLLAVGIAGESVEWKLRSTMIIMGVLVVIFAILFGYA